MFFTCIRGEVEVKDGDDGDENTGDYDVDYIVQRLPLNDQVEDHVLKQIVTHALPAWLVHDAPLAALWGNSHILSITKHCDEDQQNYSFYSTSNKSAYHRGSKQKCKHSRSGKRRSCDHGLDVKQKQL